MINLYFSFVLIHLILASNEDTTPLQRSNLRKLHHPRESKTRSKSRSHPPPKRNTVDICIIGAGPAGIQAAFSAEKKGLTTAVFEKNSYIGGKTKIVTVADDPRPYIMGAVIHEAAKHSSIRHLFEEFDVEMGMGFESIPLSLFQNGVRNISFPEMDEEVMNQTLRYYHTRAALSHYLDGPNGYLSDYQNAGLGDLHVPFMQWLTEQGMERLFFHFWLYMTTFGYGHPLTIPALYGLKYYSAEMVSPEAQKEVAPFQTLLERMAATLKGEVHLNVHIGEVTYRRGSRRNTIYYHDPSQRKMGHRRQHCNSIMLAFPPTLHSTKLFVPPGSYGTSLTNLLSKVRLTNYNSILYRNDGSGFDGFGGTFHTPLPFIPPYENLLYFKQYNDTDSGVVAYNYAASGNASDEEVLTRSLASYAEYINGTSPMSVNETVLDWNRWDYFPHVEKEDLDEGFFRKFHALQGGPFGQYYVGGLFNFEMVQDAMEHADFIIETFF